MWVASFVMGELMGPGKGVCFRDGAGFAGSCSGAGERGWVSSLFLSRACRSMESKRFGRLRAARRWDLLVNGR